jgi:hypothetical protein
MVDKVQKPVILSVIHHHQNPLESILNFIILRILNEPSKLIQTVMLLPCIQEVPTEIAIEILVNFNVLLSYYPKVTAPHTVVQFLLAQGIAKWDSAGSDNANMC